LVREKKKEGVTVLEEEKGSESESGESVGNFTAGADGEVVFAGGVFGGRER